MGSSMVMMCSARVELMRSTMAASVVDLPEPVTPVTSTRPRGMSQICSTTFGRNHAKHKANVAALLKYVHTEASETGDAIGHVDFRGFFEFLLLPRRHHAERHVQHVFGGHPRLIGQRYQIAIDAQVWIVPHLQVQVGSAALHGDTEQVIDIHAGRTPEITPMMT